jgi:hypothetical protein
VNNTREWLWQEFKKLHETYGNDHQLGYHMIEFSVKMLMDLAPRHKIALETIRIATEEGIKWHVEERGNKHHD